MLDNLEKDLTKTDTIVSIVEECESQQTGLKCPCMRRCFTMVQH